MACEDRTQAPSWERCVGHPDEVEQALVALAETVTRQLSAQDWERRLIEERAIAILTKAISNGILAVVEIDRASGSFPDNWPVELRARVGAGYEPALNLMPLLTLSPRPLIAGITVQTDGDGQHDCIVTLTGLDAVASAAGKITDFVSQRTTGIVATFPDAAALEAAGPGVESRLVLLAAMGRHDEARVLLEGYSETLTGEPQQLDLADRRFLRQMTRWLDAGGPPAPALANTISRLPQPALPSWSEATELATLKHHARKAARRRARGRNAAELREVVGRRIRRARHRDVAPSVLAIQTDMLLSQQRRFGRMRSAVKGSRMLASAGKDTIELVRHSNESSAAWLQPPERASYPMLADPQRRTAVELEPSATQWIERILAEARWRVGPCVLIRIWLASDERTGALAVFIGDRRVGHLRPEVASEFEQVMHDAAAFDEDPFVATTLTELSGITPALLELPLPRRRDE